MDFECPRCGDKTLCFHESRTYKTPLAFENGKFEGAGKVEEIDINEKKPRIRCGNGHSLELMSDQGYVYDKDDMEYYLEERQHIKENEEWCQKQEQEDNSE